MAGRNERNADISDWLEEEVNRETRETAIFIDQELVRSSAVRDGFLRASFNVSVGSPSSFISNVPDSNGSSTINRNINQIGEAKGIKYPTIYIQNNQPYAYRIMELGYSQQTPPKKLSLTIQAAVNR